MARALPTSATLWPVSYTHLDVYKRQLQGPIPEPQGQKGDGTHVPENVDSPVNLHGLIQIGTSLEISGTQMSLLPRSGHEFHLFHILFSNIWGNPLKKIKKVPGCFFKQSGTESTQLFRGTTRIAPPPLEYASLPP